MIQMLVRNRVQNFASFADIDRARAFLSVPESAEAGSSSGVIDGEYYLLNADEAG